MSWAVKWHGYVPRNCWTRDAGTDSVGSIHDGDLCICSTNWNLVVIDFFSDVDRQGGYEVNCVNDLRDFKDAESVRSGQSHVPSQPASLPPYRDPGGMLSRPGGMLSRNDKPPDIWNTHGISGNFVVNPPTSSSSPFPGGLNPWVSNVTEDTSPHVTSERQNPDTTLDPRSQSGPLARNSFDPKEGRFPKN